MNPTKGNVNTEQPSPGVIHKILCPHKNHPLVILGMLTALEVNWIFQDQKCKFETILKFHKSSLSFKDLSRLKNI